MARTALDCLLAPRSVAIVGASDRTSVGGRIVRNMQGSGFKGPLYPVNPNYDRVGGMPCYPDVAALPETPDCVVIAVPFASVLDPLAAAAGRGVRAAVVLAEGFADAGTKAGRARQERLKRIADRAGMAVSGPNSMGVISFQRRFASAFTNLPDGIVPGGISVVSQSGGLMNATIELGHNRTVGFNYLISAGNEAVLTSADFIRWLADDADTRVIVNIVEGVRDGRAYARALAYAAAKKPVVVLKLGRTDSGAAAAMAHTGTLAGSMAAFDAVIAQSGACRVETIDEMIETADMFAKTRLPRGKRVFIFSVSGGATVLSGDLARDAGLALPPVPAATSRKLGEILGVERRFRNPMDVVGAPRLVARDNMTRCLRVLDRERTFDAIAFVLVVQRDVSASHRTLHEQFHAEVAGMKKPVVMISEMAWHPDKRPPPGGPPVAGTLDLGLRALRHLIDYAEFRRRAGKGRTAAHPRPRPRPLRLGLAGRGPLGEPESAALIARHAKIPFARWRFAETAAGAARAARAIGFPVALKAVVEGLAHKTEAGAVRLGLTSAAEVARAGSDMGKRLRGRGRLDGFMVQEMVAGGVEMILGGRIDPQFGPVVLIGAGGILAELARDTALAPAPVTVSEAGRLIAGLEADRLLRGFRGQPACDRTALARAVAAFSRFLAAAEGEIAEIDINPVKVLEEGRGIRALDALVVPAGNSL